MIHKSSRNNSSKNAMNRVPCEQEHRTPCGVCRDCIGLDCCGGEDTSSSSSSLSSTTTTATRRRRAARTPRTVYRVPCEQEHRTPYTPCGECRMPFAVKRDCTGLDCCGWERTSTTTRRRRRAVVAARGGATPCTVHHLPYTVHRVAYGVYRVPYVPYTV